MVIATLGGLYSLFVVPFLLLYLMADIRSLSDFPAYISMDLVFAFIQWISMIGGIIILVGVVISIHRPKIGWIVVLIGGIIGGGSVPAIVASTVFLKPRKGKKKVRYISSSGSNTCYECGRETPQNVSVCESCKQKKSSMFD